LQTQANEALLLLLTVKNIKMLPMRKYYELENLVKLDEHSVDTNLGLLKTSVATPSDPKEEKKSVI
jgi:hypothetical protein